MVSNPERKVVFTPQRPWDVLRLYADPHKFIDLCAWQPKVSFDEGIKSLMESESGRNWEEVYDEKKKELR